MRVTWRPAPGNVVNYRVTYKPKSGGRQLAARVPGGNTSTVLKRLAPLTTYNITVLPVYSTGEGKAREGEGTTCMLVCSCITLHFFYFLSRKNKIETQFQFQKLKHFCNMNSFVHVVKLNSSTFSLQ